MIEQDLVWPDWYLDQNLQEQLRSYGKAISMIDYSMRSITAIGSKCVSQLTQDRLKAVAKNIYDLNDTAKGITPSTLNELSSPTDYWEKVSDSVEIKNIKNGLAALWYKVNFDDRFIQTPLMHTFPALNGVREVFYINPATGPNPTFPTPLFKAVIPGQKTTDTNVYIQVFRGSSSFYAIVDWWWTVTSSTWQAGAMQNYAYRDQISRASHPNAQSFGDFIVEVGT